MASYFSRREILKEFAEKVGVKEPVSFHLITPARQVIESLYNNILDLVDIGLLKKTANTIVRPAKVVQSQEESAHKLQPIVGDSNIALAFAGREELLRSYLYQTASLKELKLLNVPRGITTDSDKLKALRAVLNLLTRSYSRVILWLDDVERITDFSGRDLSDFQIFIRDLLDYVPSNLDIIMIFTMSPTENVEDTLVYLGEALRSRLYNTVTIGEMSEDDLLEYVTDLLRHYRITRQERK